MDMSDRERLDEGLVTDFIEATKICLALLQNELDTAPEGEDEDILEEIRDTMFAVRVSQEVDHSLFPCPGTVPTPEERLHFRDVLLRVGARFDRFIEETLEEIGETIPDGEYEYLLMWLHI
jgi:hypothetical protein